MDTLFTKIVGGYGYNPNIFYDLLFKEAEMIIKGRREQEEQDFTLMQIACTNAIGTCFGGKKFKPIQPFKREEKKSSNVATNKNKTREELLSQLQQIKDKFQK